MRAFRLALAALILTTGAGMAQGWQLRTFDDGSFFSAAISPSERGGPAFLCGERSPRGLSPQVTGNTEPDITAPGVLRLNLGDDHIGQSTGDGQPRGDVIIVAGGQGWRLPAIRMNELYGTWEADLADGDAMLAAMATGGPFEVQSRAGQVPIPHSGFAEALAGLRAHCRHMFASIGKPWPGATSSEQTANSGTMAQVAEAAIERGCNGPAERLAGYLLTGNIDGDGQEDAVLDWGSVTCLTSHPRPFCGASMCSADVYLSAQFPRTGQPEGLLGLGVRLQPLSNGAMAVATGGSLSMCQPQGGACELLYWWNGAALVGLR